MKKTNILPVLALVLAAVAAFILVSGRSLPPIVASHFAASGHANGFMPRGDYLVFMLLIALGVPLLLALIPYSLRSIPLRFVNLPNREYWLAPERREETLVFLQNHGIFLSVLLVAFLCYIHWLVVRANESQPAFFSPSLFVGGFVLFLVAIAIWVGVLIVHFSRRP
jgi:hypothetical protein